MFPRLISHFISNILVGSLCSASSVLALSLLSLTAVGNVQPGVEAPTSAKLQEQNVQGASALEPGRPVEREMWGGQKHIYRLGLIQ
jgi:hypothetical protein